MTRLASRKHKQSVSASVEVTLVKREYVSCCMACESFLIRPIAVLLIGLPFIICLRPGCIPVVEDFDVRDINPEHITEFLYPLVTETAD